MAVFDTTVWIATGTLALMYLMAGVMKLTKTAMMQEKGKTMRVVSPNGLRGIGVAEVLGAFGVVLPPALDVLPWVAVVAAAGLALIQIIAIPLHIRNGERETLPMNSILLALALFVLLARSGAIP